MHLVVGAVALTGAAAFVVASWRHRLPLLVAPAVILWGLGAALWPEVDPAARTDLLDVGVWVLTVGLCLLAVAHTSRTRAQQSSPFARGATHRRVRR